MWSINHKYVIEMIAVFCTIFFAPSLSAQNMSAASGKSIGEFLTPDGRFDLERARRSGFQGSLNMDGFTSGIDVATGKPVFRSAAKATAAGNPDDVYWDNSMSSSITGINDDVNALTVYAGKLIAGGSFTIAGGVSANNIAAWDGSSWSLLGEGMGGDISWVSALTVYNGKLIAGGWFTTAGGVEAIRIAAWDGSSWSSLGSGIGGGSHPFVRVITVYDGKLIAGGEFTTAGGGEANYIAAWDGSSWSPLGSGMNYGVYALTVYDGKLIAGGRFTTAGGVSANNIAAWDGSSWSSLGSGISGSVYALTVFDGKLIAGGGFITAGGVSANCIAAWDGSSWSPLGSGMNHAVMTLTVYDGKLIAGGGFDTAGGVLVNMIAAWDGSSWSPFGSGMGGGDIPYVSALTVYDEKLIVGGTFLTAGGKVAPYITSWTKKSLPTEIAPPTNVIAGDVPNDNGHFLKLSWTPSLSENTGSVSRYRIFRSRTDILTEPLPLSRFSSLDSLNYYDAHYTILIDSVAVGKSEYIDFAPLNDTPYYYWIQAVGVSGASKKAAASIITSVQEKPTVYRLGDAYPNPFNPSTTIDFSLAKEARVVLKVYNLIGQEVAILKNEMMVPGIHTVVWNAKGMPTGLYYYALKADGYSETKKMTLLK